MTYTLGYSPEEVQRYWIQHPESVRFQLNLYSYCNHLLPTPDNTAFFMAFALNLPALLMITLRYTFTILKVPYQRTLSVCHPLLANQ